MLVAKGGVQTIAIDPGRGYDIVDGRIRITLLPKDLDGTIQSDLRIKLTFARHATISEHVFCFCQGPAQKMMPSTERPERTTRESYSGAQVAGGWATRRIATL